MNEVYVKLMAGKKGFKIPPEVEEILLKNLQDSIKADLASEGLEIGSGTFITSFAGVSEEQQPTKVIKKVEEDPNPGVQKQATDQSMNRQMNEID
jgi:hypothetical protein